MRHLIVQLLFNRERTPYTKINSRVKVAVLFLVNNFIKKKKKKKKDAKKMTTIE